MLENRKRELSAAVQGRMRDVRTRDDADREPTGDDDSPSAGRQHDIDLALIQMKAEALGGVDAALRRLKEGRYGLCAECGAEIAHGRLQALPFAVRCTDCERAREATRINATDLRPRSRSGRLMDVIE